MDSIEQREQGFYDEVAKFRNVYSPEMLRAFYDFWSETNPNGKKMRFEMQKVFCVSKRLARWKYNQETKFGTVPKTGNKANRRFPNFYDPLYIRNNRLSGQELSDYYTHLRELGYYYNTSTHKWEDNGIARINP